MAEIKYNNLYNQLNPMDKRYYDQQFSKKYVPGQENIMLTSQPAYEQMKAAYEAEQQIPETGFFDSLFGSASAAEPPSVPNLSYQNITPTFDLGTGITNTSAATPVKIGIQDILSQYNIPGLRSQNLQDDLAQQIVEENRQKVVSGFINAPQDYYPSITGDMPYSGIGSMRYKTPRTIADQNRVLGQTFTPQPKSFRDSATLQEYFQNRNPVTGIMDLFSKLPTPMNILRGGLESLRGFNQRIRNTDFGRSRTLQEYFQRREARKDAERLKTVGQQLQQASDRGGGYQPTSREQNVARTESRRADKGLGQGGVYGL